MSRTYRNPRNTKEISIGRDYSLKENIRASIDRRNLYAKLFSQYNRPNAWYMSAAYQTDKEIIAACTNEWERQCRDGRNGLTQTNANTGFKRQATRVIRRATKKLIHDIMCNDDWECCSYPHRKLGKPYVWNWD